MLPTVWRHFPYRRCRQNLAIRVPRPSGDDKSLAMRVRFVNYSETCCWRVAHRNDLLPLRVGLSVSLEVDIIG